jgi:hypothetical protein
VHRGRDRELDAGVTRAVDVPADRLVVFPRAWWCFITHGVMSTTKPRAERAFDCVRRNPQSSSNRAR